MENKENKQQETEASQDANYVEVMSPISTTSSGGEVTIHTMPKRYMATLPAATNAKGIGFMILLLGFLFLIVAFFLIYVFLIKQDPQVNEISTSVEEQVVEEEKKETENSSQTEDEKETSKENKEELEEKKTDEYKSVTASSSSSQGDKKYLDPLDSDKDGLSDYEEIIFDSSPHSDDTDGDTYQDLQEVNSLYDPATKGNKLIDSIYIDEYINEKYKYSFYIFSAWPVEAISGSDSLIIELGRGQFIQFITQENSFETLDEWYMDLFEVSEIKDESRIKNGNWAGIVSESGLTYYLKHPSEKYVVTMNYEIGDDNTLYYKNIFDMMFKSLHAQ